MISREGRNPAPDCSFCGKAAAEAKKIVAGERGAICDACIELAHDIVSEPDPVRDAAPDLYRTLEALVQRHKPLFGADGTWVKILADANAALKKARGE